MNKCKDKICSSSQICNPATGRCVLKTGKIGSQILKNKKSRSRSLKNRSKSPSRKKSPSRMKSPSRKKSNIPCKKPCRYDQICNPKSGRCVSRNGNIGKNILSAQPASFLKSYRKPHVDINNFDGTPEIEYKGYLYLVSRYKDTCVYKPSVDLKEVEYQSDIGVQWTLSDTSGYTGTLLFPLGFFIQLSECKHRLFACYLTLHNSLTNNTHANFLIYDTKLKTIERFEPHGSESLVAFNQYKLDYTLEELFKKHSIKYISPTYYCPYFGLQKLEEVEPDKNITDPAGWCAAWSLLYADLRIKNPDIPQKKLLEDMISSINKSGDKSAMTKFIRNYANFILHNQ
jgi:hypothetical protein